MMRRAAVLACFLAAAGGGAGRAADAPSAKGVLHIYNWTDYTAPDLIKKFTVETGIKVTLDTFDSNETLLAKLKAGATGYDIVVPSNDFVPILIAQKLIQPVDAAAMPNFAHLDPRWTARPWDPQARYSVPWQWGSNSFIYDTKVYGGPVDSLATLFKPPAVFKGQVAMFGSASEVINLALVALGKPLCDSTPADMQAVSDLLEAQKPFVKVYNTDGFADRVGSGEATMSMASSGDAVRARLLKPSLRFVYGKEGAVGWMDNLVVPVGAPDVANAKAFLNFMMAPENAALESNFSGYQNAVAGSDAFLKPDLAKAPEFNPPADIRFDFSPSCDAAAIRAYDRIWTLLRQ